jgi:hypothetical protein
MLYQKFQCFSNYQFLLALGIYQSFLTTLECVDVTSVKMRKMLPLAVGSGGNNCAVIIVTRNTLAHMINSINALMIQVTGCILQVNTCFIGLMRHFF